MCPVAWAVGLVLSMAASQAASADAVRFTPTHLRIVGGMAATSQYRNHEEPFWTRTLPALTGQQVQAEIEPFDRAGIRGQDVLRLMQTGVVPFGTAVFGLSSASDPLIGAPALAGINPDMATLRRTVAAFRPALQKHLREHNGIELLAIYAYPAQVIFCNKPFAGLADLARRRVRVSGAAQADLVEALGGTPVYTAFADLVPQMRAGALDCAITGAMSGNTNGLHELTTHVHALAINWGLSLFAANQAVWNGLRPELRQLLQQQLPQLEQSIWATSERESVEGLACNAGAATCRGGKRGHMTVVSASPADAQRLKQVLVQTVLPRWAARCGTHCVDVWNSTLAPSVGVTLEH